MNTRNRDEKKKRTRAQKRWGVTPRIYTHFAVGTSNWYVPNAYLLEEKYTFCTTRVQILNFKFKRKTEGVLMATFHTKTAFHEANAPHPNLSRDYLWRWGTLSPYAYTRVRCELLCWFKTFAWSRREMVGVCEDRISSALFNYLPMVSWSLDLFLSVCHPQICLLSLKY